MLAIFEIILPVFLLLLCGFLLGKTKLFDDQSADKLIAFVWWVAIPALLFRSLAAKPLPLEELVLVGSYYAGMYLVYATAMLVGRWLLGHNRAEQAMFAFATCFANAGFVGIPVLGGAFGDEGVRLLLIIISFHSLTLIPVSSILVSSHQTGRWSGRAVVDALKGNPVLVALLIALTWSLAGIPYPDVLDRILEMPAAAAAPVGLFAVGLSLTQVRLEGDIRQAGVGALGSMIVMPLIIWLTGKYLFDLPPLWLGVATLYAALPTGLIPYTFALRHNLAPRRVASMILLTMMIAPVTLSVLIWLLGDVGQ